MTKIHVLCGGFRSFDEGGKDAWPLEAMKKQWLWSVFALFVALEACGVCLQLLRRRSLLVLWSFEGEAGASGLEKRRKGGKSERRSFFWGLFVASGVVWNCCDVDLCCC